jgi:hypothetical protein
VQLRPPAWCGPLRVRHRSHGRPCASRRSPASAPLLALCRKRSQRASWISALQHEGLPSRHRSLPRWVLDPNAPSQARTAVIVAHADAAGISAGRRLVAAVNRCWRRIGLARSDHGRMKHRPIRLLQRHSRAGGNPVHFVSRGTLVAKRHPTRGAGANSRSQPTGDLDARLRGHDGVVTGQSFSGRCKPVLGRPSSGTVWHPLPAVLTDRSVIFSPVQSTRPCIAPATSFPRRREPSPPHIKGELSAKRHPTRGAGSRNSRTSADR